MEYYQGLLGTQVEEMKRIINMEVVCINNDMKMMYPLGKVKAIIFLDNILTIKLDNDKVITIKNEDGTFGFLSASGEEDLYIFYISSEKYIHYIVLK